MQLNLGIDISTPSFISFDLFDGTEAVVLREVEVIELPPSPNAYQLRRMIKAENPNSLASVDAADLRVYATKADYGPSSTPIEAKESISNLGKVRENPIYVVAPLGIFSCFLGDSSIYLTYRAACRSHVRRLDYCSV